MQNLTQLISDPDSLDHLLDSVADGLFTVDLDLRLTSLNSAAEKIIGIPRQKAIGRPCHEIFHSQACDSACPIRETLRTGDPVTNRELDLTTSEGREIPVSISASPLHDSHGAIIGAIETIRDLSNLHALHEEIERKFTFQKLVSRNKAMHRLFNILPDVAASEATVLLHGESGTGKELFAEALHQLSSRSEGPLVVVNCGALPEPLLEAEIFGSKRGAYTGSVEDRPGRLETAQGGTLFLDEIGDLPLPLQVKLLRVLENHEYQPLGARSPVKANVRFVTATHRDLEEMVEEGTFRRDLFFRINVVSLTIPPLRERKEDIPLLVDLALDRFNHSYHKHIRGISPEVMQLLLTHDYPGNVRELLNLIEQTVILCRTSEIDLEHLPAGFLKTPASKPLASPAKGRPSKQQLSDLLEKHHGNRNRVAEVLGIDRTTLWRWMKRADLL